MFGNQFDIVSRDVRDGMPGWSMEICVSTLTRKEKESFGDSKRVWGWVPGELSFDEEGDDDEDDESDSDECVVWDEEEDEDDEGEEEDDEEWLMVDAEEEDDE